MRRATSIVLALAFILVSVTGLFMALGPRHGPGGPPPGAGFGGPFGDDEGGGFEKGGPRGPHEPLFPKQLHEWGAYLLVIASLIHIGLNWRPLLCHLGLRRVSCGSTEPS